ncbi:MAG TPA: heme A synthase [Gammaproteobacteria bacterium]|jgi:cytochrome c oxidase assembly protein subunit 15|nr:heme A synthase [Gammaproteobacteria bacterium]
MQENRIVGYWLLACAAVVYFMIVVGGMTRLTQSGLSMVEWEPIMGIIPPMTEAAWTRVFELYRLSPEYLKVNAGMSLAEFKGIFWWEYGHRVLGRVIGMVYLIPLLFFVIKGWIPKQWWKRLAALFILGGLQGLMGWYMVQSGLVDMPRVSQYRLTAHLGLAVIIFTFMLWFALDILRGEYGHGRATKAYLTLTWLSVFVVFMMMLSGGFVAGTRAGFIMNTFPTMNGEWIPAGVMAMQPWWKNLFENAVTVQFVHRLMALFVIAVLVTSYWYSRRQKFGTASWAILVVLALQVCLGIAALVYRVPLILGAGHQAGAVALLSATIYVAHRARKSRG